MNKSTPLTLCLVFLSACQTQPKPQSQGDTEANDPDVVVMQGFGANSQSSSLLGVKPMTFEELSDCAQKIGYLKKEASRLKANAAKIEGQKSEFDQKGAALDAERITINARNTEKVADFNKRIEEMRIAVGQLDKEIDTYNNDTDIQVTRSNEFNVACANRSFRQSDMSKLPSELRDTITLNSKVSDLPIKEDAPQDGDSSGKIHLPASPGH